MDNVWVTLGINSIVWFFLHTANSIWVMSISDDFFVHNRKLDFLFKTYQWEKDGRFWQDYFYVKNWKEFMPDGASIFRVGYRKKRLPKKVKNELPKFILETKRAELTHWTLLIPAPFFFIWNSSLAGWINFFYALLVNVPFIIIQRYNRPRLERLEFLQSRKAAIYGQK